ncbi:MAG: guanylate kinase [Lachnospiraceae bacterium]|nr:guanylate kinase [Lachnospiraceae bacterium]
MKKGILIVISGFSGAGKGTVVNRLINEYDDYALSVSMTTRSPRPGEVDGKSYFFVSREEFIKRIEEKEFLEYAVYCDNFYGTPLSYVEEQMEAGKNVILEIEVQGALQIKEKHPDALLLFVTPPSIQILKDRLYSRQTESVDVIHKRLAQAEVESRHMHLYDYVIVNDNLDECVKNTNEIIKAAHSSTVRSVEFIETIKEELKLFTEGE